MRKNIVLLTIVISVLVFSATTITGNLKGDMSNNINIYLLAVGTAFLMLIGMWMYDEIRSMTTKHRPTVLDPNTGIWVVVNGIKVGVDHEITPTGKTYNSLKELDII